MWEGLHLDPGTCLPTNWGTERARLRSMTDGGNVDSLCERLHSLAVYIDDAITAALVLLHPEAGALSLLEPAGNTSDSQGPFPAPAVRDVSDMIKSLMYQCQ